MMNRTRKPLVTTLFIIFSVCTAFSQNILELEKRKGFKNIKLGSPVDSIPGAELKKEFKEKDEYPAKLYTVEHTDYENIGEVKVTGVEIKTYKDIIYEISVVADKDPRLMKALESIYGKADYDMKTETYFWRTENVVLKFKSHDKRHIEMLYTFPPAFKMMKDDKNKKVDDIANDF